MNFGRSLVLVCAISVGSAQLFAAEPAVLVRGANGITVTTEDLNRELVIAKDEVQAEVMAKPDYIRQIVMALYVRKFLVSEALVNGLDKQESTAAALQRSRDRILAEAAVERRDGAAPDPALVMRLAKAEYNAHPDKYMAPERVRASHILIARDKKDARVLAENLRQRIANGEDFDKLAEAYTDDEPTKARAGDLGWFDRGKMVQSFDDAVFALDKLYEVSPVVETTYGFHIIKLYAKLKAHVKPFDEVKDQISTEVIAGIAKQKRTETNEAIVSSAQVDQSAVEALVRPLKP